MSAQGIFRVLSNRISEQEENVLERLVGIEKTCYEGAKDDADKFADCMTKYTKKIKQQHRLMEVKVSWIKTSTLKCVEQNPNDLEGCKNKALSLVDQNFARFLQNIN